jgi:hypothetical protein
MENDNVPVDLIQPQPVCCSSWYDVPLNAVEGVKDSVAAVVASNDQTYHGEFRCVRSSLLAKAA